MSDELDDHFSNSARKNGMISLLCGAGVAAAVLFWFSGGGVLFYILLIAGCMMAYHGLLQLLTGGAFVTGTGVFESARLQGAAWMFMGILLTPVALYIMAMPEYEPTAGVLILLAFPFAALFGLLQVIFGFRFFDG